MPNDHPLPRIELWRSLAGSSSSRLVLQGCFVTAALLLTGCACGKKPGTPAAESASAVPGDFDRNGMPDLIWQNAANGQVKLDLYKMGPDPALQGSALLNTGIANWRLG